MEAIVGAPLRSRAWGDEHRGHEGGKKKGKATRETAERKGVKESPHTYEYGKG